MKQNKKPKQTLESAQYGLEINFNELLAGKNFKQQVPEVKKENGSENNFYSFIRRNALRFGLSDIWIHAILKME